MKFTLKVPDSASFRAGKENYLTIPANTELHRIHPTEFGSTQFNPTENGNARFSPIRKVSGEIIPTIYAAQSFECAVCEIILRCPDVPLLDPNATQPALNIVNPQDYRTYSHSVIKTRSELKVVDLTIAGQRKIGVDANLLLAGPKSTYPSTRSWAEAIHEHCPEAQGLYYCSFQYGPEFALVLFGDRIAANNDLATISIRDVSEENCHSAIFDLADSLSIDYEDI